MDAFVADVAEVPQPVLDDRTADADAEVPQLQQLARHAEARACNASV